MDIQKWKESLGYEFRDPSLLQASLTHPSGTKSRPACNQQLEFLGDAVLNLVISTLLLRRFPHFGEGRLTRLRSNLVSKNALAFVAETLHLGEVLKVGSGFPLQSEPSLQRACADSLEALIGAVFLDCEQNLAVVTEFVERHFAQLIAQETGTPEAREDPRTKLQIVCEKAGWQKPEYQLIAESGTPHEKQFHMFVRVTNAWGDVREFPAALGRSKNEARFFTAKLALEELAHRALASMSAVTELEQIAKQAGWLKVNFILPDRNEGLSCRLFVQLKRGDTVREFAVGSGVTRSDARVATAKLALEELRRMPSLPAAA